MSNTERSIPVSEESEDSHEEPKAGVSGAYDSLNEYQQKFVANMLAGDTPPNAYRNAGYKSQSPWHEAWRLRRSANVRAALDELGYVAGVPKAEIIEQLRSMLAGCDVADFEPWLNGTKTLQQLRDEGVPTHALSKVHIFVGGDGRSIQREDRMAVLKMLSELLGYNAPTKSEVALTGAVEVGGMSDDRLRELAGEVFAACPDGHPGQPGVADGPDGPGAETPRPSGVVEGDSQ